MLSKREHFQQWRGCKSNNELPILEMALFIDQYVNSVDNLEVIKAEAETKFEEFNQSNSRSWSTVVFTKLFIDEAIAQLPETAAREKGLLINLSTTVTQLYENSKKDTATKITALLDDIEQLIAIDNIPFTDKKQYKSVIFSSYMLFHLIKLSLNKLDLKTQLLASSIIDLKQMKGNIDHILQKIEEKGRQLEQVELIGEDNAEYDPLNSIKVLLNKRYLKVLSNTVLIHEHSQTAVSCHIGEKPIKQDILERLVAFEADIDVVSLGIADLIKQKTQKVELELKIENISKLLSEAQKNERKITGGKFFLDFIRSHSQWYQTLLENTEGSQKIQLLEKIEQIDTIIETPSFSLGGTNGFSGVASTFSVYYQYVTPQMVQDVVSYSLPTTLALHGDCKAKLKQLAELCLSDLNKQLEKKEREITALNNRIFNKDEKIKRLIRHQSPEQLAVLKKENDDLKEAVEAIINLVVHIKENLIFLNLLKNKEETLNEFIRLNDTILYQICNFLSRFFSYFKTEKVQMIDEAIALKKQVNEFAAQYQNAIGLKLIQIEENPFFDEKIKNHIKRRLRAEDRSLSQKKKEYIAPSTHNVRLLMDSLSYFFANKSHQDSDHSEEEESPEEVVLEFSLPQFSI